MQDDELRYGCSIIMSAFVALLGLVFFAFYSSTKALFSLSVLYSASRLYVKPHTADDQSNYALFPFAVSLIDFHDSPSSLNPTLLQ